MASILPGVGGASLETNRGYSYQASKKLQSIRTQMNSRERFSLNQQANTYNQRIQHQLGRQRKINKKPDFDAFLKLLTEQLKHQDPLKPLEDKDFIAQMAQFSSLGEMTKFNKYMKQLLHGNGREHQFNLLGKKVHWYQMIGNNKHSFSGVVSAINTRGGNTEIMVGNKVVNTETIFRVETMNQQNVPRNVANNNRPTNQRRTNQNNVNIFNTRIGNRGNIHNMMNIQEMENN